MIHDCFLFWNEFPQLEIRLHELDGVVDRFVLVEARMDHQLREKPLLFEARKHEFARWPIEHIIVDRIDEDGSENHGPAFAQRKAIRSYADPLPGDDLVLISDVDEIPARWAVELAKDEPKQDAWAFHQRLFYYYLNWEAVDEGWWGTRAYRRRAMPDHPRVWRAMGTLMAHERPIERAGWHLSWWGGPDAIREKLRAFSDRHFNRPEIVDGDYIEACLAAMKTIHARRPLKRVSMDTSMPRHVIFHPERFSEFQK